MNKKIISFLLASALLFSVASCDNTQPVTETPTPVQETPSDSPTALPETATPVAKTPTPTVPTATPTLAPTTTPTPSKVTPYRTMNMGPCKTLEGTCVLFNIFVSDNECTPFTESDKEDVWGSQRFALNYLCEQAERYNQSLSFIFNTEDTMVDYKIDDTIPRDASPRWGDLEIVTAMRSQYDINALMKKYNADRLFFVINVNKSGRAYTWQNEGESFPNEEVAVIYRYCGIPEGMSESDINYANTVGYAHEILHLFGAIDLYNLDARRLALAKKYFPNDLMLSNSPLLSELTISNLDAYLIGWTDELEEEYWVFLE